MTKKSIVFCTIVVCLFLLSIIWWKKNQNGLKNNGVIVEAKILRVNFGGRSTGGFQCLITYQNETKEISSFSSISKGKVAFVGKTFPAMYLPSKNILEVLITPKDFKKFNIPFPDSLNWVIPYVRK